jgi:hypothetical protein
MTAEVRSDRDGEWNTATSDIEPSEPSPPPIQATDPWAIPEGFGSSSAARYGQSPVPGEFRSTSAPRWRVPMTEPPTELNSGTF